VALNPELRATIPPESLGQLVAALEGGLGSIYLVMAGLAALGILVALRFPGGAARLLAHKDADG
jgi:hypothetical protein